jgi:SAM-dependent methyltransferase
VSGEGPASGLEDMNGDLDVDHLTALAPPGALTDWRLVVVWEAAVSTGLVDALPGTTQEVAARTGLDADAVRVAATLLAAWGLVSASDRHGWQLGPRVLTDAQSRALAQQGVWIRRWSTLTGPRLRDRSAQEPEATCAPSTATGLRLLAEASARSIQPVVDACLRAAPAARRVLDLGGGHGEYSLEFARRGLAVTLQDLPGAVGLLRDDERFAGVSLHAESFFDGVAPGPFDLVLCCTVTNMFGAQAGRELVRRIRPQLAPGGVLALVTYMRDRGPVGAAFGVQMLVATPEGDAHSSAEHRAWVDEAGLVAARVEDLGAPPLTMVAAQEPQR